MTLRIPVNYTLTLVEVRPRAMEAETENEAEIETNENWGADPRFIFRSWDMISWNLLVSSVSSRPLVSLRRNKEP